MAILKLDDFVNDEVAVEIDGKKFQIIATIRSMAEFEKISKEYNESKKTNLDLELFSRRLGIIIFGSEAIYEDFNLTLKSLKLSPKKEKTINEKVVKLWLEEMLISPSNENDEKKK